MSSDKKKKAWAENGLEDWGAYMAAKKEKLEDQFEEAAEKEFRDATSLFSGVAIFVNGYTNPCADELKRSMMANGGIYHHYMRPGTTTHIIASNLPYSKIAAYSKSRNPLPICKPEWITDSLAAGELLDWRKYVLYSNCTKTQPQLRFPVEADRDVPPIDAQRPKVESAYDRLASADAARSARNTRFLTEFYNNSRLHLISTMSATLKDYVDALRAKSDGTFAGLERLKNESRGRKRVTSSDSEEDVSESGVSSPRAKKGDETVVMHIDMDCFFVSVGLRERPELRGLPVAVTHARADGPRAESLRPCGSMSEIASCSYEARKAGLRNGMFLGQALKLCPELKTISYDFEAYRQVSYALYDTVASYTLLVEAVSCDEMYADVTLVLRETGLGPLRFAKLIREEIKRKTGCPVSTGFGNNKLQARLATRRAKPDGQFYLDHRRFRDFVGSMSVRDLPGVGYSTMLQLSNRMNVRTCSDLGQIPLSVLQREFGKKSGETLHKLCRGIDDSKLTLEHVRKSVSAEVNYGIRFESPEEAVAFLRQLSHEVSTRLRRANTRGRSVALKLMVRAKDAPKEALKFMGHGMCDNFTKSNNLNCPIDDPLVVAREVISLWNQMRQPYQDIRGIGIQISRLESTRTNPAASIMNFITMPKEAQVRKSGEDNVGDNSVPSKDETRGGNSRDAASFLLRTSTGLSDQRGEEDKDIATAEEGDIEAIDENVLAELPEHVRREISGFRRESTVDDRTDKDRSVPSRSDRNDESVPKELAEHPRSQTSERNESSKKRQTHQENYFKHAKATSIGKPIGDSTKMPSIEEIDVSVLVELPENIRNEIMNEYRASTRWNEIEPRRSISEQRKKPEKMPDDADLSFSQVDPEFLAGLSEDMKTDVRMYCMLKRKEKFSKITKSAFDTIAKNRNPSKVAKKNRRLSKSTNKTTTNVRESVQKSEKNEFAPNKDDVASGRFIEFNVDAGGGDGGGGSLQHREEIISHHSSFTRDKGRSEEQEMLTRLVNYLFTLPRQQVKMQIQTWISKNERVNEIDSLSLATFLSMLPRKKRLEDLHVLIKTMHRCIAKTGSCVWHVTYGRTISHVQHYMQIEYNSKMMLPTIKCDLCDCETNPIV